ncbi:MAG: zinc ribbon domain-containing protein [Planctomycetota bacterium]|nr:MAG: zinc ribbon domain-containing protein [Planctomycetota bacterium]REJ92006.1 MAG: zinc ribbon domain-containing protein [Planctomycetota bacterium]REK28542.1 MAG: zinc ribbon domain-containing protein [Planctomycetota bacterium]REK39157.1 MAG: zinc ribbon domain-containing protein [Planctomycetota bacterium]
MPLYEYQCDACGHKLEILQRISDKAKRKCPKCDKPKLVKIIHAPAYHNHYSPMHPRIDRGRGY